MRVKKEFLRELLFTLFTPAINGQENGSPKGALFVCDIIITASSYNY